MLGKILREHNPALKTTVIPDKARLAQLPRADLAATRLLAFCSSVIVPADLLAALPGPSYNFHPGPPDRPGRYPSVFAVYEKAERYGVTVHEMTARVDAGPIVAAEWFAIPAAADVVALEKLALGCLVSVFRRLAPFLALNPRPLPRVFIPWSGRARTKAECDEICRVGADMPAAEVALRNRACGSLLRS
ncbi:MAG: formyltransferase family protein [Rhodospirillaceae bacterium]